MELTRRQQEIVRTALELIAAGGIRNLTIRNLADRLGLTEPAIYRHFRNKSEIVRTLIGEFDRGIPEPSPERTGFEAAAAFTRSRFAQVAALPLLVEKCRTEVELALPEGFRVEALKSNGLSTGTIPTEYRNGKLRFTTDTSIRKGGILAYHLIRLTKVA